MSSPGVQSGPTVTRHDRWLLTAAGVHLLGSTAHGVAHGFLSVPVPNWLLPIAVGSLFVGPLAGCWLVVRGRRRAGAWLLLLTTFTGVTVETLAHFVVANPDHVSQTAHGAYAPTAVGSTAGTALAVAVAVWYLGRHRHGGVVSSAIDSRT